MQFRSFTDDLLLDLVSFVTMARRERHGGRIVGHGVCRGVPTRVKNGGEIAKMQLVDKFRGSLQGSQFTLRFTQF